MASHTDFGFLRGLFKENPTFVLVLGMCPTLGVTTSLENALGMGLSVLFVLLNIFFYSLLNIILMFVIGFLFAFYLGIDKLFINTSGRLITERPQFYLSLTAMLIGTQLFLAGFLGEIILRTKNNEERYKISEVL